MLHSSTQLPPVTAKHQLVKILRDKSEQTRMYNSLISTSAHQPVPLKLPYMNYLCAGVKQQCAKPPPPHQLGVWGSTVTSSRQRGLGKPGPQQFSYILNALDGISCCILGAFWHITNHHVQVYFVLCIVHHVRWSWS